MKKSFSLFTFCIFALNLMAQNNKSKPTNILLSSVSKSACKCIDSIHVGTRSHAEVAKDINACIDRQVMAYQLGAKMFGDLDIQQVIENPGGKDSTQVVPTNKKIIITSDKDSREYKEYYYEIERFMMDSCPSIKDKMATLDKTTDKSLSDIPRARDLYTQGIAESKNENYKAALPFFEQAVKVDPNFAFAWDNIGVCYRKLDNYDKAIEAYNKSLAIDPNGTMPLQNIAVAYQYKKQYKKAVAAYERLAAIDKNNPEIYYGIGQVYTLYLNEYEKGLDNMCKAYNLYIEQQSPYRSDAEKIIGMVYAEMKKQNKEAKFWDILKQNNIAFDDKE